MRPEITCSDYCPEYMTVNFRICWLESHAEVESVICGEVQLDRDEETDLLGIWEDESFRWCDEAAYITRKFWDGAESVFERLKADCVSYANHQEIVVGNVKKGVQNEQE